MQVKPDVGENTETVWLIDWKDRLNNDFAIAEEVTVKGSTIKVELNGTVILDCDLSKVNDYLADHEHPGKNRTKGYFGFAGHNDPVMFRNISIKQL